MKRFAITVRLKVKNDKINELIELLEYAKQIAQQESYTKTWYAYQIYESTYGIFATFDNENDRERHLNGEVASTLIAKSSTLLASALILEQMVLLQYKEPDGQPI